MYQFFVAAELCRRELVAVITLGNCPNTDILVSNAQGTRFAHVQVKTFVPGNKTCSVGMKAQNEFLARHGKQLSILRRALSRHGEACDRMPQHVGERAGSDDWSLAHGDLECQSS